MLKAKHINRKKMLLFHAVFTMVIVAACVVAWAVMGNQKADAKLTGEESQPLTLEHTGLSGIVGIRIDKSLEATDWNPNIKISLGGYPEYPFIDYELGTTLFLTPGDKVSFAGINPDGFSKDSQNYGVFKYEIRFGEVELRSFGNVMSLLSPDCSIKDIPNDYCFTNLFEDFDILIKAPLLPANNLKNYCYSEMFSGCTRLKAGPELPATNLNNYCYSEMFSGCTGLTAGPELPATNLKNYCYSEMFSGCTDLKVGPDLPAKSLASGCYSSMFYGCTALETMLVSFTSWGSDDTTLNWLDGVQAKGTFLCPLELYIDRGASKIPMQWDVKRLKTLDNHIISINTAVFPYDGSEKRIEVSAKYGEKDYTSQLVVQGTTSATSPGIYTYKAILDPTPTSNDPEEIVPAGEYTGTWCIFGSNGPSPTPDPGGGGASGEITGTGTAQTGDVPLYAGIALLVFLAIHAGAYLYWRRAPKNAKHL